MGGRSGTTYKKRQKELARQDRQREKIARRAQKKLQKQLAPTEGEDATPPDDEMTAPADERQDHGQSSAEIPKMEIGD
jgi:hypothetical protein